MILFMSFSKPIFFWPKASTAEQLEIRVLVITLKDFVNFGDDINDVCARHALPAGGLMSGWNCELQSDANTYGHTDGSECLSVSQ